MYRHPIPELAKKSRVILNTDAKNEADDQYAIVHAILTPSFDLHGIISAHFGNRKSATSQRDSHEEILRLLDLMGIKDQISVPAGAPRALPRGATPVPSRTPAFASSRTSRDHPPPPNMALLGPFAHRT